MLLWAQARRDGPFEPDPVNTGGGTGICKGAFGSPALCTVKEERR